MAYAAAAWTRRSIFKRSFEALSGEIHWFRAAEILGVHSRSVRRWRERYEQYGYHGVIDKRHQRALQRRARLPSYATKSQRQVWAS